MSEDLGVSLLSAIKGTTSDMLKKNLNRIMSWKLTLCSHSSKNDEMEDFTRGACVCLRIRHCHCFVVRAGMIGYFG